MESQGRSRRRLDRGALSGIKDGHRKAGVSPSPTDHPIVRMVYSGISRTYGVAPRQVAPVTAETLAVMLSRIGTERSKDIRDRAVLLIGMAGAFRRSELVALDVADLSFGEKGLDVVIRKSKTDQERAGQSIAIPHGRHLMPVDGLRLWLDGGADQRGADISLDHQRRPGDALPAVIEVGG